MRLNPSVLTGGNSISNCLGFKKVLGDLLGPWASVLGAQSLDLSSFFVIEVNVPFVVQVLFELGGVVARSILAAGLERWPFLLDITKGQFLLTVTAEVSLWK